LPPFCFMAELTYARHWPEDRTAYPGRFNFRIRTSITAPFPWLPGPLEPHRQKENEAEEDEVADIDLKDNLITRSEIFIFSDEDEEEEEEMLEDAKKGEVSD
jgi:hypothetical protein